MMKKLIALLLAAMMILGLCACKDAGSTQEPETTNTPTETQEETQEEIPTEEETETIPMAVVNADMAQAEGCIEKSVEELYALIGEPLSANYVPSCLNPGVGEDGELEYDGFIVYTYREGDTEIVQYVEEA